MFLKRIGNNQTIEESKGVFIMWYVLPPITFSIIRWLSVKFYFKVNWLMSNCLAICVFKEHNMPVLYRH